MVIQILIKEEPMSKAVIAKKESFDFETAMADLGKLESYMNKLNLAKEDLK